MSTIQGLVISEDVFASLKEREVKQGSEKTAGIYGKQGKVIDLNITVLEGELWEEKRDSLIEKHGDKVKFLLDETYNVNGSITIEPADKKPVSFYVNNDLLSLLIKGNAIIKTEKEIIVEPKKGSKPAVKKTVTEFSISDRTFKFEKKEVLQLN